jgi:Fe-S cluster biogenesis protein NfuA
MPEKADENVLQRIDALLQQSESLSDPKVKRLFEDTIRALMDLHGEGLSRMLERLAEQDAGCEMIDVLAEDPAISSLLLVYNLHPKPLDVRVREALDSVRPYLESHGGSVQLLGISDEGAVNLQMQGSCHGCPSSAVTLKTSIEKAIYEKAPDVVSIRVEGMETPAVPEHSHRHSPNGRAGGEGNGFVPIEQLTAGGFHLPIAPAVPLTGAVL